MEDESASWERIGTMEGIRCVVEKRMGGRSVNHHGVRTGRVQRERVGVREGIGWSVIVRWRGVEKAEIGSGVQNRGMGVSSSDGIPKTESYSSKSGAHRGSEAWPSSDKGGRSEC